MSFWNKLCGGKTSKENKSSGSFSLFKAVRDSDLPKVKALLKENPEIASGKGLSGWTPLHDAADIGTIDVLEFLLAKGADVNANADSGETPLHIAVRTGNVAVVKLLLDHGAQINARDKDGWTPRMSATMRNHDEVAELLSQHGGHH